MRLICLLVALTALIVLPGCRATIPATDTERPGVDVTMSGPGFRGYHCGTTACPPTPDLLSGTGAWDAETIRILESSLGDGVITIVVTVGDSGGVKAAGISLFGDCQLIESPPGAEVRDIDAYHKTIFVNGVATAPRTLLGLTAKIKVFGSGRGVSVKGIGLDFGGSSGRSNSNETRATNFQVWHRS